MTEFTSPDKYTQQLNKKVAEFRQQLDAAHISHPETIDMFASPPEHYRMRAEFKLWHQGDKAHYAMTDPDTKKPVFLDQFPVATKTINLLMPKLLDALNNNELLRKKCFQVEFLSTLNGDTLVTLIYHKPLTEEWSAAIAPVKNALNTHIIGRSRKQKIVLDRDYVNETLTVNNRQWHYRQIEGSFTQPNARVCEQMIGWVLDNTQAIGGDLLELYCGNGNFTLPLSTQFTKVLATEISKTSVQAAQHNIKTNQVDNITIARMSSEEFVQAMDKVREFRRLKDIDLDSYHFSTVFVDPPRAGLDPATEAMVQRFDHIAYISCNPATLVHNLKTLAQTHNIQSMAAFDQFPYTPHLEVGVILSRK